MALWQIYEVNPSKGKLKQDFQIGHSFANSIKIGLKRWKSLCLNIYYIKWKRPQRLYLLILPATLKNSHYWEFSDRHADLACLPLMALQYEHNCFGNCLTIVLTEEDDIFSKSCVASAHDASAKAGGEKCNSLKSKTVTRTAQSCLDLGR